MKIIFQYCINQACEGVLYNMNVKGIEFYLINIIDDSSIIEKKICLLLIHVETTGPILTIIENISQITYTM